MRFRKATGAALIVAGVFVAASASATTAQHSPVASPDPSPSAVVSTQTAPNSADMMFVAMMIPHHFQALVMSELAPGRSHDDELLAMANRIDVEQSVEIGSMQGWQGRNSLEVTDAQQAYEEMLHHPEHLEHMGMASPAQLAELSAAQGTTFDVLFLQLMIRHHEGAVRMTIDVIVNGNDQFIQQVATDMMTTQNTQIHQMETILANKTP
ncbi:DUF305 domain-containing protein [Phytoactinopolyspora limicola]|uniref:DUF305 domain-containing protein n=1 Tax=Phytoactinopolyspora limicola TaxID=2715536 RepID=UPI00140AF3DA|nr:DUF305 domain-containing protein [Phytoactinopolyspora limicola]